MRGPTSNSAQSLTLPEFVLLHPARSEASADNLSLKEQQARAAGGTEAQVWLAAWLDGAATWQLEPHAAPQCSMHVAACLLGPFHSAAGLTTCC